jgi:hypothetical protein
VQPVCIKSSVLGTRSAFFDAEDRPRSSHTTSSGDFDVSLRRSSSEKACKWQRGRCRPRRALPPAPWRSSSHLHLQAFKVHAAMAPAPRRLQPQNPTRCQGYCNLNTSTASAAFLEARQLASCSAGLRSPTTCSSKQPRFCSTGWSNSRVNVLTCCASPGGPVVTTDADSGQEPSAQTASSSQPDATSKATSTAVLFTDITRIGCQVRPSFYARTSASCTESFLKV